MNIAVIRTGGKQYLVKEGDTLTIERVNGRKVGDTIDLEVLLADDGSTANVGAPLVSGAKVSGTILEEGRGVKKIVVKYKAKSRYHKKRGHRQPFTRVKINKV